MKGNKPNKKKEYEVAEGIRIREKFVTETESLEYRNNHESSKEGIRT